MTFIVTIFVHIIGDIVIIFFWLIINHSTEFHVFISQVIIYII